MEVADCLRELSQLFRGPNKSPLEILGAAGLILLLLVLSPLWSIPVAWFLCFSNGLFDGRTKPYFIIIEHYALGIFLVVTSPLWLPLVCLLLLCIERN